MKYLLTLLLLSFNAYAHMYTIDYTNDKNWAQQGIEADTLEELKVKASEFVGRSRLIKGEWTNVELGSFASRTEMDMDNVESTVYFHPSNFAFTYKDLTPDKAAAKIKQDRHEELRDQGQTRNLTVPEINEYLFN